jgi:hypothetical protein
LVALRKIKNDLYLKVSFQIGGFYNILAGIFLFIFSDSFPSSIVAQFPNPIFLQIIALFLIVVGYFLVYSSQNPKKLVIIGVGSAASRLGYFLIVLVSFFCQDLEIVYLVFGIVDACIAILILIPILLTEGISWHQLRHF